MSERDRAGLKSGGGKLSGEPHLVLAGGGTAGHVNPLLSVASALRGQCPGAHISVIGTAEGLEQKLVPAAGFELDRIEKVPFPRRLNLAALKFPLRWCREVKRAKEILKKRKADLVLGFGGYASAPAYRAARLLGLPLVIHEQNARAGMANRLGARWADYVGTAYDHTGIKAGPGVPVERIGLPLRAPIADLVSRLRVNPAEVRFQAARQLGLDPVRLMILITGGSLGAASINQAVSASAECLLDLGQVVHLTGSGKADLVKDRIRRDLGGQVINDLDPSHRGGGDYHIAEYLERIDLAFACADLVICRAGAGTVNELAALGLPAVYVPLPIGNGEQRFNALPVVQAGGGLMVSDADLTPEWINHHIPAILNDPVRLKSMRQHAWDYGIRDAAEIMASKILSMLGLS